MTKPSMKRGFTLVELAIVITIIGLLIGGVIKGQDIVENAKITSTISQVRSYEAALITFKTIYNGLPGDSFRATERIEGCNASTYCVNGNGDGLIGNNILVWYSDLESSPENWNFWKQLQIANLVTGVDITWNPSGTKKFGVSSPKSSLDEALGFHVGSQRNAMVNHAMPTGDKVNGIVLVISIRPGGEWNEDNDSVPPRIAYQLDEKMDDGLAYKGHVFSVSSGWWTGCGTPSVNENGPTGYGAKITERRCDVGIVIGR